jgi:hypothetical protein
MSSSITETFEGLNKLKRDIKKAAATLGQDEARFLVDTYYTMQENRIRAGNQVRALTESKEPNSVLSWLGVNAETLERNIKSALTTYADAHAVGNWSQSIMGIGPVLSAGLIANLDLEPWVCALSHEDHKVKSCREGAPHEGGRCRRQRISTVGHIWRFVGYDPTVTWNKGERRPWNASMKTLCWKIGESFVKVSNHDDDYYGHVYRERKEREQKMNDALMYKDQADKELATKKYDKSTEAYKHYTEGKLPPGRIHARAKRYAVKLFLSHWHWVAFESKFKEPVPLPYVITHMQHVDLLIPPNYTPLPRKDTLASVSQKPLRAKKS